MKRILLLVAAVALLAIVSTSANAQTRKPAKRQITKTIERSDDGQGTVTIESTDVDDELINDSDTGGREQIIIRKNTDKNVNVDLNIQIHGDKVTVNGKDIEDFNDKDISILKNKIMVFDGRGFQRPQGFARVSPFRAQSDNFNHNYNFEYNNDRAKLNNSDFKLKLDKLQRNMNRPVLGVRLESADEQGAKIVEVTENSGADKAGLKEGDIITKVNETTISNPAQLTKTIGEFKPGDKVTITYKRGKKQEKLTAVLGKSEDMRLFMGPDVQAFNGQDFNFDFQPRLDGLGEGLMAIGGRPRLGIKAQDVEEGKGVRVIDVDEESAAGKSGIKEGDIITDFNGVAVNSADDLVKASRDAHEKSTIDVKVLRDGKEQSIQIKIPKKLKTANL
jgi:serine protease Do